MQERKKFLDFLTDANGNSYYVENGVVKYHAQAEPLQHSPDGWRDHQVKVARNATYFGLFRTFSLPLKFVKQAAQIVRNNLYKLGIEDVINYTKLRLNYTNGKHELFYQGELDLTTAKDELTNIEVSSIDGGMAKILKANEATNYEIELSGNGVIDVVLDGAELAQNAKYLIVNGSDLVNNKQHLLGLELINNESKDNINAISVDRFKFSSNSDIYTQDFWCLKASSETTLEVSWNFGVTTSRAAGVSHLPNPGQALLLRIFDESNVATAVLLQQLNGSTYFNNTHNIFSGTKSVSITSPVKRVYLMMLYTSSNNPVTGTQADDATYWEYDNASSDLFDIKYSYRKPSTVIKAISALELGNRLVKAMANDSSYSLVSSLLTNHNIYLTSGDAIRGFDAAKLKTNFKDYFLSLNRNLCIGISVLGKKMTLENRAFFYDKSTMIYDLGTVKNIQIKPAIDLFFNNLKIGYPDKGLGTNYEDLNGRYEFNTTVQYKSFLSKTVKELDLTANYRADMFGITFTQINLEGKQTTDSSSDNDVFMLDIDLVNGEVYNLSKSGDVYAGTNEFLVLNKITPGNGISLNNTNNGIQFNGVAQTVTLSGTVQFSVAGCNIQVIVNSVSIGTFTSGTSTVTINQPLSLLPNDVIILLITAPAGGFTVVNANINFTLSKPNTFRLYRFPNQSTIVSGLPYPATAFNIRLSPKRCLFNHGAWIKGILSPAVNKKITYQTATKNTIKTTISSAVIDEAADVSIGDFADNYLLPFYVSFETPVPKNLFQLIAVGLNGYFKFSYRGVDFKGFPIEASQKPGDDESQTFTVLLTSDNDLTKLIYA